MQLRCRTENGSTFVFIRRLRQKKSRIRGLRGVAKFKSNNPYRITLTFFKFVPIFKNCVFQPFFRISKTRQKNKPPCGWRTFAPPRYHGARSKESPPVGWPVLPTGRTEKSRSICNSIFIYMTWLVTRCSFLYVFTIFDVICSSALASSAVHCRVLWTPLMNSLP